MQLRDVTLVISKNVFPIQYILHCVQTGADCQNCIAVLLLKKNAQQNIALPYKEQLHMEGSQDGGSAHIPLDKYSVTTLQRSL